MFWTTSAIELKAIADTLKDILTTCWFVFTHDKIELINIDPEKVVTVKLDLRPTPNDYNCVEPFSFCMYIQVLYKVLRGCKPNEKAVLQNNAGSGNLSIEIREQNNNDNIKMKIILNGLQDPLPKYIVPNQMYDKSLTFNASRLYYIFHDLGAISRVFTLTCLGNSVGFQSQDESGTNLTFCEPVENLNYKFSASFLVKYIEKYLKPKLGKHVTLRMKQGTPLSVVYYLETGFLELTIAPLD